MSTNHMEINNTSILSDKVRPPSPVNDLRVTDTMDSFTIPRDLFEKIYLSPQNRVQGTLRKQLANPTPVCLLGFLIAGSPLACDLMGWRGAGNGAATIGDYYFFGGLLQIIGCVGEFILGNTFPCAVFACYGAFWLSLAADLTPFFNAAAAYTNTGGEAKFAVDTGFFLVFMMVVSFIFLLCSTRTNLTFVFIFINLTMAFGFLTATYWNLAIGHHVLAGRLQKGAGACVFILCIAGWYLFAAQMLEAVDMPFTLPVGDLSRYVKGRKELSSNPA